VPVVTRRDYHGIDVAVVEKLPQIRILFGIDVL
jgi:hypothetical protein